MAATRKCVAEIKQNKIEQVLAYREQVPRSGRVLESFLGYYWLCFSSMFVFEAWLIQCSILRRLEIQYLHPKQILIRLSRLHKQISQVSRSLFGQSHLRCWFLRPANCLQKQFRVAQMSSTESKDIKCHASVSSVLIREPHVVFLGKNWHFSVNSAMFGIKRNLRNQAFYLFRGLGRQMTTVLSVSAQITSSCMARRRPRRPRRPVVWPHGHSFSFVVLCETVIRSRNMGRFCDVGRIITRWKCGSVSSSEYSLIPRESK